jgi:hypothetical protein
MNGLGNTLPSESLLSESPLNVIEYFSVSRIVFI